MSSPDPLITALAPITTLVIDWALWMIPLVLLLVALRSLLLPKLRGILGERRVGAVLERIGTECLHDVIFSDGRGGLTQTSAPPLLEWASPPSRELKADRSDCNAAIAAVLADNSEQHRRRRDRACGKPTPEPSSTAP